MSDHLFCRLDQDELNGKKLSYNILSNDVLGQSLLENNVFLFKKFLIPFVS